VDCSTLTHVEIPVLKKHKEAVGYLQVFMGAYNFCVNLYVPSKVLEKANDIPNSEIETKIEETCTYSTEDMIDVKEDTNSTRRTKH